MVRKAVSTQGCMMVIQTFLNVVMMMVVTTIVYNQYSSPVHSTRY